MCPQMHKQNKRLHQFVLSTPFYPFSSTLQQVRLPSPVKLFCVSHGSICSCPTWETSCFCCSSCILTEWQTLRRNKMPQAVKQWIKQHWLSVSGGERKCHVKERMDEKWPWPLRLKWNRRSGRTGSIYVRSCCFYVQFPSLMAEIQNCLCSPKQIQSQICRTHWLCSTSLWVLLSAVLH